jgi:hypothetical protein
MASPDSTSRTPPCRQRTEAALSRISDDGLPTRSFRPAYPRATPRRSRFYAYITGHLDTDDERAIPLCRLGYLGLDDKWEFALHDPATDTYTALLDGSFTGTPQEALDCSCRVHLADIPVPPPNSL